MGYARYYTDRFNPVYCNRSELLGSVYIARDDVGCIFRDVFTKMYVNVTAGTEAGSVVVTFLDRCTDPVLDQVTLNATEKTEGKCIQYGTNSFAFVYYADSINELISLIDFPTPDYTALYINRDLGNCSGQPRMLFFPSHRNYTGHYMCRFFSDTESAEYTDFGNFVAGTIPQSGLTSPGVSLMIPLGLLLALLMLN